MPEQNRFHWAAKVSRRDIQRLYDWEAKGLMDEELLDNVMYSLQARVSDMFEVCEAQKTGRVRCRSCGSYIEQALWMGSRYRDVVLACPKCDWHCTCGEYLASYTGKDMLPGSRTELFQEFLERHTEARNPRQKMLLLDWLIHAFHVQSGVSGRLVAMNVIQGSRDQLIEPLSGLAATPKQRVPGRPGWSRRTILSTSSGASTGPMRRCWRLRSSLASGAGRRCRKTS